MWHLFFILIWLYSISLWGYKAGWKYNVFYMSIYNTILIWYINIYIYGSSNTKLIDGFSMTMLCY